MGQELSGELTEQRIEELKNSTKFTAKEITEWYAKFKKDFPEGVITKDAFVSMYSQMFPNGDAKDFSLHIFRAYDADGNGVIDFSEFIQTLNISSKGSLEEKIRWAFKMYDVDGNGSVSKQEAIDMITSIYKMKGFGSAAAEQAEEAALNIFLKLDKDMDDNLSEMEFVSAAKNSSSISKLFKF
ncbi:hypothetical protein CAPTEDRAFT_148532 [Capitella teleta]|uniref:EF-hand domain-containing protein n=1 Tax=Capitella teleta TaxID=283909 RepID=R7U6A7_CAPTE|nr:hypothetical protein CAPTEDRAFT_148532 [Capitella teleta]|eukprot:ELT98685.1 hypothetical protein CAPTEDRAFT_148532 [Capitella teleta]